MATATAHAGVPRLDRRRLASTAAVLGAVAYNWWVAVPFLHGLLPSVDSFFSDLEVRGARDAALFGHLDVLAGSLFVVALVLASRPGPQRSVERGLFVAFALAVAAGGFFPFSCAEGTDRSCRSAEWSFRLPIDHYLHVACSAVEFLAISSAILLGWHATRHLATIESGVFRGIGITVLVGYVPLAVAYFSDHDAALVEPVFFALFTAAVLTEVLTAGARPGGP